MKRAVKRLMALLCASSMVVNSLYTTNVYAGTKDITTEDADINSDSVTEEEEHLPLYGSDSTIIYYFAEREPGDVCPKYIEQKTFANTEEEPELPDYSTDELHYVGWKRSVEFFFPEWVNEDEVDYTLSETAICEKYGAVRTINYTAVLATDGVAIPNVNISDFTFGVKNQKESEIKDYEFNIVLNTPTEIFEDVIVNTKDKSEESSEEPATVSGDDVIAMSIIPEINDVIIPESKSAVKNDKISLQSKKNNIRLKGFSPIYDPSEDVAETDFETDGTYIIDPDTGAKWIWKAETTISNETKTGGTGHIYGHIKKADNTYINNADNDVTVEDVTEILGYNPLTTDLTGIDGWMYYNDTDVSYWKRNWYYYNTIEVSVNPADGRSISMQYTYNEHGKQGTMYLNISIPDDNWTLTDTGEEGKVYIVDGLAALHENENLTDIEYQVLLNHLELFTLDGLDLLSCSTDDMAALGMYNTWGTTYKNSIQVTVQQTGDIAIDDGLALVYLPEEVDTLVVPGAEDAIALGFMDTSRRYEYYDYHTVGSESAERYGIPYEVPFCLADWLGEANPDTSNITSLDLSRWRVMHGNDWNYSYTDNESNYYENDYYSDIATIFPGVTEITLPDNAIINSEAFKDNTSITTVNNLENAIYVGESAFSGCTNLTSINFPMGYVGNYAFNGCTSLTDVVFNGNFEDDDELVKYYLNLAGVPWGNGSPTMGYSVFDGCSIENISGYLSSIGNSMFNGCASLLSCDLDFTGVTVGAQAFKDCSNMAIETLDLSGVTSVGAYAFSNCDGIENVILGPGVDFTGNNEYASPYMFSKCDGLKTIDFNGMKKISSNMFYDCTALEELDLDGIEYIGTFAFSGCELSNMETITIPDSIMFAGDNAFQSVNNEDLDVIFNVNTMKIGLNLRYGSMPRHIDTLTINAPYTEDIYNTEGESWYDDNGLYSPNSADLVYKPNKYLKNKLINEGYFLQYKNIYRSLPNIWQSLVANKVIFGEGIQGMASGRSNSYTYPFDYARIGQVIFPSTFKFLDTFSFNSDIEEIAYMDGDNIIANQFPSGMEYFAEQCCGGTGNDFCSYTVDHAIDMRNLTSLRYIDTEAFRNTSFSSIYLSPTLEYIGSRPFYPMKDGNNHLDNLIIDCDICACVDTDVNINLRDLGYLCGGGNNIVIDNIVLTENVQTIDPSWGSGYIEGNSLEDGNVFEEYIPTKDPNGYNEASVYSSSLEYTGDIPYEDFDENKALKSDLIRVSGNTIGNAEYLIRKADGTLTTKDGTVITTHPVDREYFVKWNGKEISEYDDTKRYAVGDMFYDEDNLWMVTSAKIYTKNSYKMLMNYAGQYVGVYGDHYDYEYDEDDNTYSYTAGFIYDKGTNSFLMPEDYARKYDEYGIYADKYSPWTKELTPLEGFNPHSSTRNPNYLYGWDSWYIPEDNITFYPREDLGYVVLPAHYSLCEDPYTDTAHKVLLNDDYIYHYTDESRNCDYTPWYDGDNEQVETIYRSFFTSVILDYSEAGYYDIYTGHNEYWQENQSEHDIGNGQMVADGLRGVRYFKAGDYHANVYGFIDEINDYDAYLDLYIVNNLYDYINNNGDIRVSTLANLDGSLNTIPEFIFYKGKLIQSNGTVENLTKGTETFYFETEDGNVFREDGNAFTHLAVIDDNCLIYDKVNDKGYSVTTEDHNTFTETQIPYYVAGDIVRKDDGNYYTLSDDEVTWLLIGDHLSNYEVGAIVRKSDGKFYQYTHIDPENAYVWVELGNDDVYKAGDITYIDNTLRRCVYDEATETFDWENIPVYNNATLINGAYYTYNTGTHKWNLYNNIPSISQKATAAGYTNSDGFGSSIFAGYQYWQNVGTFDISRSAITEIPAQAFMGANIGNLILPETYTFIGKAAFQNATIGNEINLKDSGVIEIDQMAFYNTRGAADDLPETLKIIDGNAIHSTTIFAGKDIHIPEGLETVNSRLTYLGQKKESSSELALYDVTAKSITVSGNNIADLFNPERSYGSNAACIPITRVFSGHFDDYIYYGDDLLINGGTTTNEASDNFRAAVKSPYIDAAPTTTSAGPNFNIGTMTLKNATYIPNGFFSNYNISSLVCESPEFDYIGYRAFYAAPLIKNFEFNKDSNVWIDKEALQGSQIEAITGQNFNPNGARLSFNPGGRQFANCQNLTRVVLDNDFFNAGSCGGVDAIADKVPEYMFYFDKNLKHVEVYYEIADIGANSFAGDFNLDELIFWNSGNGEPLTVAPSAENANVVAISTETATKEPETVVDYDENTSVDATTAVVTRKVYIENDTFDNNINITVDGTEYVVNDKLTVEVLNQNPVVTWDNTRYFVVQDDKALNEVHVYTLNPTPDTLNDYAYANKATIIEMANTGKMKYIYNAVAKTNDVQLFGKDTVSAIKANFENDIEYNTIYRDDKGQIHLNGPYSENFINKYTTNEDGFGFYQYLIPNPYANNDYTDFVYDIYGDKYYPNIAYANMFSEYKYDSSYHTTELAMKAQPHTVYYSYTNGRSTSTSNWGGWYNQKCTIINRAVTTATNDLVYDVSYNNDDYYTYYVPADDLCPDNQTVPHDRTALGTLMVYNLDAVANNAVNPGTVTLNTHIEYTNIYDYTWSGYEINIDGVDYNSNTVTGYNYGAKTNVQTIPYPINATVPLVYDKSKYKVTLGGDGKTIKIHEIQPLDTLPKTATVYFYSTVEDDYLQNQFEGKKKYLDEVSQLETDAEIIYLEQGIDLPKNKIDLYTARYDGVAYRAGWENLNYKGAYLFTAMDSDTDDYIVPRTNTNSVNNSGIQLMGLRNRFTSDNGIKLMSTPLSGNGAEVINKEVGFDAMSLFKTIVPANRWEISENFDSVTDDYDETDPATGLREVTLTYIDEVTGNPVTTKVKVFVHAPVDHITAAYVGPEPLIIGEDTIAKDDIIVTLHLTNGDTLTTTDFTTTSLNVTALDNPVTVSYVASTGTKTATVHVAGRYRHTPYVTEADGTVIEDYAIFAEDTAKTIRVRDDGDDVVKVKIDGSDVALGTLTYDIPVDNGLHTVFAKDSFGDKSTTHFIVRQPNRRSAVFINWDDSAIKNVSVIQGTNINNVDIPTEAEILPKTGYHFTGWTDTATNTFYTPDTLPVMNNDMVFKATFEKNTYDVTWKNFDDSVIAITHVEYEGTPVAPDVPEREGHTLVGWTPVIDVVTGDITYKTLWDVNKYEITWKDDLGNTIKTEEVEYGKIPNAPHVDDRAGEAFKGWTPEITPVTEPKTYTTVFEHQTFAITWVNYDGTVIRTDNIKYGEMPVAPTAIEIGDWAGHAFIGWTPYIVRVTGPATYTTIWDRDTFEINFLSYDGKIISTQNVPYGEMPDIPAIPGREGFIATGWTPEVLPATEPKDYVALYSWNYYTVKFVDWDDTVLKEELVRHNLPANPPENPVRDGYTFRGWDKPFGCITSVTTIKTIYDKNGVPGDGQFTVRFIDWNGTILKTEIVNAGGNATAPNNPTRAGYSFRGWNKAFTNIQVDTDVTAVYDKNGNGTGGGRGGTPTPPNNPPTGGDTPDDDGDDETIIEKDDLGKLISQISVYLDGDPVNDAYVKVIKVSTTGKTDKLFMEDYTNKRGKVNFKWRTLGTYAIKVYLNEEDSSIKLQRKTGKDKAIATVLVTNKKDGIKINGVNTADNFTANTAYNMDKATKDKTLKVRLNGTSTEDEDGTPDDGDTPDDDPDDDTTDEDVVDLPDPEEDTPKTGDMAPVVGGMLLLIGAFLIMIAYRKKEEYDA